MFLRQILDYKILNEIGIGGMSRLYLAFDPQNQRQVVIKLLPAEFLNDLGYRARFEREAQLIAALKHEAIVPVYEYGADQGQPFIVMQYMTNGSLADRLIHGPLSPDQAGKVLARISSALHYAHRQGIIHRDLKSSNILFDQDDNAYLADFGIAVQSGSSWQGNLASGTPNYMSPERALEGKDVDVRSDVYSLGVIAFEMLTGGLPYDGELPITVILKHIHDPPPSLGAVNPDLPAALDPVLHRALAKDPQERYATAEAFNKAFQRALRQSESRSLAVELQPVDALVPDGVEPFTGLAKEPARVETASPARPLDHPVFPDLSLLIERKSLDRSSQRQTHPFYAFGLVTWLAILLAAFTAIMVRAQELFPSSNVEIVYDESAIAVVNLSDTPIDLSELVFQRLNEQGKVTATFLATQWDQVNPEALRNLPSGDCFQLLRTESKEFLLTPGNAPAKPRSCDVSRGWLVAGEHAWHFWTPEDEEAHFQIAFDNQIIQKCRITDGTCDFFLPAKE